MLSCFNQGVHLLRYCSKMMANRSSATPFAEVSPFDSSTSGRSEEAFASRPQLEGTKSGARENIGVHGTQRYGNLSNVPASQQTLSSWKEIAAFFGRGIRTVQRWERELQLPVYRPKSGHKAPVLAFSNELERWSRSRSIAPSREFKAQDVRTLLQNLRDQIKSHQEEVKRLREQTAQLKQLREEIHLRLREATEQLKSENFKRSPQFAHFKDRSVN